MTTDNLGVAFCIARDEAYSGFDADPESLLATVGGGPGPGRATIIHARLVGYDEQVVDDLLMDSYKDRWLVPIRPYLRGSLAGGSSELPQPSLSAAVYEPVNWFADVTLNPEYARELPLWAVDDLTFEVRIRFLLYRRTS